MLAFQKPNLAILQLKHTLPLSNSFPIHLDDTIQLAKREFLFPEIPRKRLATLVLEAFITYLAMLTFIHCRGEKWRDYLVDGEG